MAEHGRRPSGSAALFVCLLLLLLAAPAARAAEFGIGSFTVTTSTSQAGAHADLSSSFGLATDALGNPVGSMKNVRIELPAGMIGDAEAIERCTFRNLEAAACTPAAQVGTFKLAFVVCHGLTTSLTATAEVGATELQVENTEGLCQEEEWDNNLLTIGSGPSAEQVRISRLPDSHSLKLASPLTHEHAVGEPVTHIATSLEAPLPLFNLSPFPGHVATFGAYLLGITVLVQVNIAPTGHLVATLEYASTILPLSGGGVTLWGVPGDPSHDALRCDEFLSTCGATVARQAPFMTMPAECSGGPLATVLTLESWHGVTATSTATAPEPTGCSLLSAEPSLQVRPETTEADTPSGYEVGVTVPQREEPQGLATPPLKDIAVTLPAGASLSPAFAEGLGTCSEAQLGAGRCPNASRIGGAEIVTPLLREPLKGSVYFGTPTATVKYPLLVRIGSGDTVIEFEGRAAPDPDTGQVTAIFEDAPQLPFKEFRLNLFGGPTAPLDNPQSCGVATSSAAITAYGGATAAPSSRFTVTGACDSPAKFEPSLVAGTKVPLAAAYSPFTVTLSRADGEAELGSFSAELPSGLIGLMRSTPLCPEPQAGAGECSSSSAIGTATVAAGAGPSPLYVSGPVYLTGPYGGAPFGLEVTIHAAAGPVDLGNLIVRSRLYVDPGDLGVRIATDPLPRIVAGVPLRLRAVSIALDKPGFIVNPSNCDRHTITGTALSATGAGHDLSVPFSVLGCRGLPFAPRVSAATGSQGSPRGNGARLRLAIRAGGAGKATIRRASITLPPALRPRLSTIQGACLPGSAPPETACSGDSIVGSATIGTPALPQPLRGRAYLIAHGTSMPTLALLLEGSGIALRLEGTLKISRSHVIRAVFDELPDVPIDDLVLNLPPGPHSLLGAVGDLCTEKPQLSYALTDQTGRSRKATAPVAVEGCSEGRPRR